MDGIKSLPADVFKEYKLGAGRLHAGKVRLRSGREYDLSKLTLADAEYLSVHNPSLIEKRNDVNVDQEIPKSSSIVTEKKENKPIKKGKR